jgi:hypothetical protein
MRNRGSSVDWLQLFTESGIQLHPDFVLPAVVTADTRAMFLRKCGHYDTKRLSLALDKKSCHRCAACSTDWHQRLEESGVQLHPDYVLPKKLTRDTRINYLRGCGHYDTTSLTAALEKNPCRSCGSRPSFNWLKKIKDSGIQLHPDCVLPDALNKATRITCWRVCGHYVELSLSGAIRNPNSKCPDCCQGGSSKGEKEVRAEVARLTPSTQVCNSRPFGFELDLLLPDLKLAIEYNGEYWHSEANPDKFRGKTPLGYHKWKFDTCQKEGIRLAFVWESDWKNYKTTISNALRRFIRSEGKDLDPILKRRKSERDITVDYSKTDLFEVGLFASSRKI